MLRPTTSNHQIARVLCAVTPLAVLLSACDAEPGCRPTTTKARSAAAIDLQDPDRSGVLIATVTSGGKPVRGLKVEFWIEHKQHVVTGETYADKVGVERTQRHGRARTTLKDRSYRDTVGDVFADKWGAAFRGTKRYCGSYDEASFTAVRVTDDESSDSGSGTPQRDARRAPQEPRAPSAERTTLPVDPLGSVSTITKARGSL